MDFDDFTRQLFESDVKYGMYLPPSTKSVFDYFIDVSSGNYIEWQELIQNVDIAVKQQRRPDDIVDTIDIIRYGFICTIILASKRPVLITGSSGVGKTIFIEQMLKRLKESGFSPKPQTILGDIFNFSERNKISLMKSLSVIINDESMHETNKSKQEHFGE
jgi:hypothetical protein